MVKKSLLAIAVVALLVATAQAGDAPNGSFKEDGKWPYVYIEVDLCKFPVYIDIGYFVTVKDCDKLEIVLKQVDCESIGKAGKFPCYQGCTEIEVRSNFDAIFGVSLAKIGDVLADTSIYWVGGVHTAPGDGDPHKLEICIDAWNTHVYEGGPDGKMEVGEVTITVKPESYE